MTPHSSMLAREIPCTEKPGGLWSRGSRIQTRQSTHAIHHSQALHKIYISLCLTEIHCLTFPHTLRQEVRFISSLLFSYFLEIIISPSLHKNSCIFDILAIWSSALPHYFAAMYSNYQRFYHCFRIFFSILTSAIVLEGLPGGASGKELAGRRFDPSTGKIPWRKGQHPTLVFLPGESHGQRSLAGYGPQGHKVSDMTQTT